MNSEEAPPKKDEQKKNQKDEDKENGQAIVPVVKKKLGLMKKKTKTTTWSKLYQNVDINQVININDMVFVNQNALKDPEHNESLLSSIFYYKMISKVALAQDNINITLKKLDQNSFPPEYYIERLRSFGDTKYYNIANHLDNLKAKLTQIDDPDKLQQYVQYKLENFCLDDQIKILDEQIEKRKGKLYLIFFTQVCPTGVMLKKIIISTQLMLTLGFNINEIALDFIKNKHIFFEIFSAKMYSTMMEMVLGKLSNMTNNLMQRQMTPEQLQQQNTIFYRDEMIRKRNINGNIQEQILSVRVKWYSPHTSLGIFEIDDVVQTNELYGMGMKKLKKFELPDMQDELKSLSHLTKIDPSLLAQNKNRCCTFKLITPEERDKIVEKKDKINEEEDDDEKHKNKDNCGNPNGNININESEKKCSKQCDHNGHNGKCHKNGIQIQENRNNCYENNNEQQIVGSKKRSYEKFSS